MTSAAAADRSLNMHAARSPSSQWRVGTEEAVLQSPIATTVDLSEISVSAFSFADDPPSSESPDHSGDLDVTSRVKKPAWNVPSNGSIEAGSVMGASWPALSESTRASPKSSSSDSLKALSDGSFSAATGPVIASPPPKQNLTNSNPNSNLNHTAPVRQRSMRRATGVPGASGVLSNGGSSPAVPPASAEMHEITTNKQGFAEPSSKGLPNNNGNNLEHGGRGGGFTPHTHGANDHRSFGGNRRGNNSGGGFQHNNYGNRRDQERGGQEWNHRNFNSRDVPMQPPPPPPPRAMRPYLRPHAPVAAPFIAPPVPVRPFGPPMGYPDMPSPLYYLPAPTPYVAHPPPPGMFFSAIDPQRAMLLKQIDFYFSPDNLCKDIFLRKNMDEQGWVSISLIAGFNRVKQIAPNIQYILDTMRFSTVVEVQGDRIRKRNDWMNWVLPPTPNHYSTSSAPQSPSTPSPDTLASHLHTVGLEGEANKNSSGGHEKPLSRSASNQVGGNLNGDAYGQDPDQAKPARSIGRSNT